MASESAQALYVQEWLSMILRLGTHPAFAVAIAATLAVAPEISRAYDYTWTPIARTMMRMDDNVRGSSNNKEAAVGFDMGGGINFKAQSDTHNAELFPRFNIRRFPVGENLDADEYSVAFNNDWLRQYYAMGLDFSYVRDSTLSTEITDDGRRTDVTDRDSVSISPNVSYLVNDRLALQSAFQFNDVSYVDAEATGFFDYRYLLGSAGANYQWRHDVLLFANFFASDFKVNDQNSQTRSYGGQSGATYQWDDTLELTGALGWIASDISFTEQQLALVIDPVPRFTIIENPIETSASGPLATVSIAKVFDTVRTKFDYSRQVSPSGRGTQSTSERIALMVNKQFTDLLSFQFDGLYEMRAAESEDTAPNVSRQNLDRNYSELRGTLQYRIMREWVISASYRHGYRQSARQINSFAVSKNALFFTIEYNGIPKSLWNGF